MGTSLATAILRQGKLKTFGHLYYTQEVFKPKSCYWPLTWNGRFQKPVELHSCTGKTEKTSQTQHNSSHHSA